MSETIGFRVQMTCDNAAFDDMPQIEVARILRDLADRLEAGESFDRYRNLHDIQHYVGDQSHHHDRCNQFRVDDR